MLTFTFRRGRSCYTEEQTPLFGRKGYGYAAAEGAHTTDN
ncbi:hypothetical protein KNP414_02718 [Paenibacillus mucilaginosus KNP414]|uniref:Uncharacterized protein n=1 Tax=Paenibacillus mucilaginosus (strain KNP414) TaxID=1036673 RepID=F8F8D2_PAEMK|nr:hypothetical protein KNP414_02718 [Paenibacillus mucilaginosus KNP414]